MRLIWALLVLLVASLPASAQRQKATGLIFLDPGQYLSIPPGVPPLKGPPPATRDLTDSGLFPEPGDQGRQGSCVGWAAAYGLSFLKNREFRWQGLQANFRFSPAFVYNQVKRGSCEKGSSILDALNVLQSQGALEWDKFPYDEQACERRPTPAQVQAASDYRIGQFVRVNVQSITEMKAYIVSGYPVIVALKAHQAFSDFAGGSVYAASGARAGTYIGGHAVLVVGYADQFKAYKIMNSWGKGWGDRGFAWIDYATFQSLALEGYMTFDIFIDRVATTRLASPRPPAPAPSSVPVAAPTTAPVAAPAAPAPAATPTSPPVVAAPAKPAPASPPPALLVPKPSFPTQPKTLDADVLAAAVRSTTEPKTLFQWKGFDVQPYSVWLELPDALSSSIDRVEYWFNHPTFANPKRSIKDSSIHIAKWRGYGCINDAHLIAHLKDGRRIKAPFDLCAAQQRF